MNKRLWAFALVGVLLLKLLALGSDRAEVVQAGWLYQTIPTPTPTELLPVPDTTEPVQGTVAAPTTAGPRPSAGTAARGPSPPTGTKGPTVVSGPATAETTAPGAEGAATTAPLPATASPEVGREAVPGAPTAVPFHKEAVAEPGVLSAATATPRSVPAAGDRFTAGFQPAPNLNCLWLAAGLLLSLTGAVMLLRHRQRL